MRFCAHPHCGVLVPKGYCPQHQPAQWRNTVTPNRIRGRKLQQMRAQLFTKQPLCVLCMAMTPPKVSMAVIRDHVVNLAAGGRDDSSNEQSVCVECHEKKTQAEALRGRKRNIG